MDVVVCVRKGDAESFWNDYDLGEGFIEWHTLSARPKRLSPGESIWFQLNGEVVAKAKVHEVTDRDMHCEVHDKDWKGVHVVWRSPDFQKLERPWGEGLKSFRGFRYLDTCFSEEERVSLGTVKGTEVQQGV